MRRRVLLGCLLPLVLVLGVLWMGVRLMTHAEPTPAHYEAVALGDVEIKVTETGTIEPLKKVEIKSKVAGRISHLYVDEGTLVRAGQLLAEIDPIEINSEVEQIRAQLAGTKARHEQTRKGVTYQVDQTRSSIRQAKENLHVAEAHLQQAREEDRAQPGLTASDIAQARANLKTTQDSMTLLLNATHPQALVQAQSEYDNARAGEDKARRNLDRQQKLLERGFVAEQAVDGAKADLAAATSQLQQAKSHFDLINEQNRLEKANAESRIADAQATLDRALANRSQVAIKHQEVLSAQASVDQARAQLEAALSGTQQDRMREDDVAQAKATVDQLQNQLNENEVHLHDTRLIATMAGVVTRRYIEQGELVTSGISTFSSGTPVLQIADLSQMLIQMSVNEVDVHKIRPGLPVEITIDGARGVVFNGRVRKVAPAAMSSGGANGQSGDTGSSAPPTGGVIRFAVEVIVDRPDSRLKPGMSARCTIIINRRRGILRLPNDAVEGEGAKAKVQVVTQTERDGKRVDTFVPRPVVAGLRGDTYVEIVSGLQPGELVKPGIYTGPPRKALDLDIN